MLQFRNSIQDICMINESANDDKLRNDKKSHRTARLVQTYRQIQDRHPEHIHLRLSVAYN